MTNKELKLIARLLSHASKSMCNFGCSDLPKGFWDGWTDKERKELDAYSLKMSNQENEFEPNENIDDWVLMDVFADKINKFLLSTKTEK